jgi:RHS repeat-associated protein
VWDGNQQVIADVIDNQFYEADCYIRGTNLVAKYNFWNGKKSEYTYYTQNAHGDVVNLTDKDGKVTKSYKYDAFGVEKNIDKNDTNAFRYCGEYYDTESGTIYLRARYYDPAIGRFISRDSFAGKQGDPLSLNRYTYCHNSPLVYIDAEGNFAFLAAVGIGAAIGGLISGVAKVIDNVRHDKDWHDGLGKAVLSGAVSGAVTAIPIPGVGPLASATITGAASNLAVDAINGDINSFKDAALSLTEGAVTGAVSHGVGKWADKKLTKSTPLSQGKNINNSAHNAAQFEKLKAQYAADEILNADRIGSALKSDPTHRAASFLPREQLAKGRVNTFRGGDGSHYTLLQTYGGFNNNKGIYEYMLNKRGQVTHQRFIKGGVITGKPNQNPKRRS